jgi:DNA-binding MarR family transcriptional regulator
MNELETRILAFLRAHRVGHTTIAVWRAVGEDISIGQLSKALDRLEERGLIASYPGARSETIDRQPVRVVVAVTT